MDRERAVVQVLRKRRKSLTFLILSGIAIIIFLNILITLTNNLELPIRNIVSVMLLIVFGIIIYLIVERIISVYIYLLTDDFLAFGKRFGKREHIILEIPIKNIVKYENIEHMDVDTEINNSYYFIYGEPRDTTKFGEFEKNDKKYRFIFNPNERINRILERKLY